MIQIKSAIGTSPANCDQGQLLIQIKDGCFLFAYTMGMLANTDWLPRIDKAVCTGCGDCIAVCPTNTLALVNGTAVVARPDACSYSGHCEAICPVAAIDLPYQIVLQSGP